jgi:endonuclease YncB( thermonuclease family)
MFLNRFAYRKDVVLQCYERDQYGRAVCDVWIERESAAQELVRRGLAWANTARPEYMHDYNVLALATKAQAAHLGLWASTEPPIAPWRWRKLCWQEHQCTARVMATNSAFALAS